MRLASLCLLMGLLIGCSEPPLKEHQQAVDAIAAARAAGAATYAPDLLKTAESDLAQYDDAVTQHDYRQALNHALAARDTAFDAGKQAADRKSSLRTEYTRLLNDTSSLMRLASEKTSGRGARASEHLRAAMRTATSAMQEARAKAAADDYVTAVKSLEDQPALLRKELTGPDGPGRRGRGARVR